MEVANHRKKAAIVKREPRIPTKNMNSQVCALHCTTDRGHWFCLSRELPLQQASNTLFAGDLRKMLTHQQDPDGMKQYGLQDFSKWGVFPPQQLYRIYSMKATRWNSTDRDVPANLHGSFCALCNSSLPDRVGTQGRLSPLWHLGPSVHNRTENSSSACRLLSFSHRNLSSLKTKRSFFHFSLLASHWHIQVLPSNTFTLIINMFSCS